MFKSKHLLNTVKAECKLCARLSTLSPKHKGEPLTFDKIPKEYGKTHKSRLDYFLKSNKDYRSIRTLLPEKCLALKKDAEQLYMIDRSIAKTLASHILPHVQYFSSDHIIADCNPGFGFIGEQLLRKGIERVRFYEPTPEFRNELEKLDEVYPGRIEIIERDFFRLPIYSYFDKLDNAERVDDLFLNIRKKSWANDPVITIIGTSVNNYFLRFLTRAVPLQTSLLAYGRVQFFLMMKPKDYLLLTASGSNLDFVNYKYMSILFDIFYDFRILEKLPKEVFLPWTRKTKYSVKKQINEIDQDKMYFVHLVLKKDLPLKFDELVPFFFFIKQFYNKNTKIVPIAESWIPGCGENIICPKLDHEDYYEDISIHTQFGELSSQQLVGVFREIFAHPSYASSSFIGLVEAELAKSDLEEKNNVINGELEENILKDIEVNLDNI